MIKSIAPLGIIIALRFFGLFVVLPVISVYALNLPHSNPTLVGIVIGGYAITQMLFQLPFGIISDKLGRKGTIILGLMLFIIGSVICAVSNNILDLMLGRFLQGSGAIGAVVTATISDLVKEEQRARAMSIMGGMIALSFAFAMIIGPILSGIAGIKSLFWLTSILALISIFILIKFVPDPPKITHTYYNVSKIAFLKNPQLAKMYITNFFQKAMMTFAFMIIPIILTKTYNWNMASLWRIYLPAMLVGIFAMPLAAILAEKKGKFKEVLLAGIIFFLFSYYLFGNATNEFVFLGGIIVFFIGFNMHEPIMQSLTTRYIQVHEKGKVLGIFNSFGYFGAFIGGFVGGLYLKEINGSFMQSLNNISIVVMIICIVWFIIILTIPNPAKKKNIYLPLNTIEQNNCSLLDTINGCDEWYINDTENIIIIKYDEELTTKEEIKKILQKTQTKG